MSDEVSYPGRDLEAMAFAVNYHRWILDFFRPYLGRRIVEVGAGTGSFSELILEQPIESLTLIEPSRSMHEALSRSMGRSRAPAKLVLHNSTFRRVADQLQSGQPPDSVVYVNVLEHIEDDEGELRVVYNTLGANGRVFLFVPAMQWLYSGFDRQMGHFRRYTKTELQDKCRRAGFRILKSAYFDRIGVLPWWIKYKLLRSDSMEPRSVRLYDQYAVPLSRHLESWIAPPFGKNVVLVAERS